MTFSTLVFHFKDKMAWVYDDILHANTFPVNFCECRLTRTCLLQVRDKRQVIFLPNSSRRKGATRPPVPPKPRLPTSDSAPTASSLTSVTSMLFSSVSETEPRLPEPPALPDISDSAPPATAVPEPPGDTSHLCPEVDYRSESSDVSSRRNSLQRGSDKSEGEGGGRGESGGRRGSELWRSTEVPAVPTVATVRRDSRRESESRRGSDHRTHQCRRGSECRRSSELARTTLDLDLGRRATSKHPLEWNRINRTAFLLHDDTFDSNGNHMRRGSLGVLSADPYDVESLRKRRTSVEDFLAKVPTCVVKNGKIVNLREEVADMLMVSSTGKLYPHYRIFHVVRTVPILTRNLVLHCNLC